MKGLLSIAAFGGAALLALSGEALSQSREFLCGEESVVKFKVIDKTTISAGPIEGRTIALRQNPAKPMTYSNGKTSVEIALNQKRITISIVGNAPVGCVYPVPEGVKGPDGASADAGRDNRRAGNKKPSGNDTATAAADPQSESGGFPAKSWGGVVRSGPGMDFKQVASLKEGEKIAVLEYAGVEMNGYRWYKIRYGGNKTGFQWGGIICPIGKPVKGAFESC